MTDVKHIFTVGWQPKGGSKPQVMPITADFAVEIVAGSDAEKAAAESAMKRVIQERTLSDFQSMWVSQIQAGKRITKWELGKSPYSRTGHPDKHAPEPPKKANPYTSAQWSEWVKPWAKLGFKQVTEIPMLLSNAQVAGGGKSFTVVSTGWAGTLEEATAVMQAEQAARQSPPPDPKTASNRGAGATEPAKPSEVHTETKADLPTTQSDGFELDPILKLGKTLTGIPATRIQEYINRPYFEWAYSKTLAPGQKKGEEGKWTVIDPIAVRERFDKVFGPHGIGWRIVPHDTGSSVTMLPYTQKTQYGERSMYVVTLAAYCLEYRLNIDGAYEWQRTSAFTDASDSDDLGYAGGGAFSSLMKQALKMMGGYDHFMWGK